MAVINQYIEGALRGVVCNIPAQRAAGAGGGRERLLEAVHSRVRDLFATTLELDRLPHAPGHACSPRVDAARDSVARAIATLRGGQSRPRSRRHRSRVGDTARRGARGWCGDARGPDRWSRSALAPPVAVGLPCSAAGSSR